MEFIIYDKGSKNFKGKHAGGIRERFDVLLHMQATWRANLLAWRIPAKLKIGFDRDKARDFQWLFTHKSVGPRPRVHVMDGLFAFAEAVGVSREPLRWDIPVSGADRAFAREVIPDGVPTLLISPCSSQRVRNFRNWRVDRYAEVARHAIARHGMKILVTGGRTALEADYAAQIEQGVDAASVKNLVGRTTLKQLLALIQRATAVLSPDSGPGHMATTVGTPVIALYASTNPLRGGPLDLRWSVNVYPEAVQAEFGRSVDEVRWGTRVRDPRVMDRITVPAVTAKLDALMQARPSLR